MNYLAHLALAGEEPGLIAGSFLGDFIKGPLRAERPPAIELGIRLHRAIDAETGRDAAMRRSALRFGPALRRLAPIYIDVLADHLLAQRFSDYHGGTLLHFTRGAYQVLGSHEAWLTADALWLYNRLQQHDGLAANLDIAAVHRGIERIARRLGKTALIEASIATLDELYPLLLEDFLEYYPRLQRFAGDWIARECAASGAATHGKLL